MKRYFHTRLTLVATILLMVAASACVEPLNTVDLTKDPDAIVLPIRILLPANAIPTKTTGGDVLAETEESALHDLQIWAFIHRDENSVEAKTEGAVAYMSIPFLSISDWTRVLDVEFRFPAYVKDALSKIDFFILGNAESIGFNLSDPTLRTLNRGQIEARAFGDGDGFGFGSALVQTVPDKGLPMSGYFNNDGKGYDISFLLQGLSSQQLLYIRDHDGEVYNDKSEAFIALEFTKEQISYIKSHCLDADNKWNWSAICLSFQIFRAVSKVHFMFSKVVDFPQETEITRIELTSIPEATYVFSMDGDVVTVPEQTYDSFSWGSATAPLLNNADMAEVDNPLRLRADSTIPTYGQEKAPGSMTAQEYEDFLKGEIALGHATRKTLYLRESDKPLQGKIYYKLKPEGGTQAEVKEATFNLTSLASSFPRNTTWNVYAYFVNYGLHVHVNVNDWSATSDNGHHLKK